MTDVPRVTLCASKEAGKAKPGVIGNISLFD
jgi:hypothetical protein